MSSMVQTISEYVCVYVYVLYARVCVFVLLDLQLFDSCWIDSDDGAIAAFIVPIVAIMLVVITS